MLFVIVVALGPALAFTLTMAIHLGLGLLLLVFGFRWLRKAVRRAAGVLPMRDKETVYVRHSNRLRALLSKASNLHCTGMAAAFQITAVEGSEVVFIVLAIGAADRRLLISASLSALTALILVAALGIALHRPLVRLPENATKFAAGVPTCGFRLFWIGKGIGIEWPGDDWAIVALGVVILAGAALAIRLVRRQQDFTFHNS